MSAQPLTEHDKYADAADDYLDQHNVYELFSSLMRKLVCTISAPPPLRSVVGSTLSRSLFFCISGRQQAEGSAGIPHRSARAACATGESGVD
jgi:hypothetical protein